MVKEEMIENYVGLARIAKKGEEPVSEELTWIPVDYLEPYCHGTKMMPMFTYRSKRTGLYKQFRCSVCGYVESRCIAKPI